MIELALTSKARLIYTSSIGVFQSESLSKFPVDVHRMENVPDAAEDHPLTETHIDPHIAEGTGYSESKWVSEELLRLVPGLRYLVVRVGQLAGGPRGTWNPKEWVPSMIQSSTVLGCLPDDEQVCVLSPYTVYSVFMISACFMASGAHGSPDDRRRCRYLSPYGASSSSKPYPMDHHSLHHFA